MGNCFYRQNKPIKVMKADGEILEHQARMNVQKLLKVYSGHTVSNIKPAKEPLRPHDVMPSDSKVVVSEKGSGVLRIKLVVSKQELELMSRKGGISENDIISQIQQIQRAKMVDKLDREGSENCKLWKPVLQSIPEVN